MQKLLVLGGSGLVGSRVIKLLNPFFDIISPSSKELDLTVAGNFEKYCMEHSMLMVNTPIINFVAYTNVDGAESEKGDENGLVYRLNAQLPSEIAEWCEDAGSRFIHISTDYVFDGEKTESAYTEEDPTNPLGWYGETKLQGEKWALESIENGAKGVVLRIEMPYGSNSEIKKDLATILYERLKNGQPIQAVDDAKISPVFIDDLAMILKQVIEQQDVVGMYHVAPTDCVTLRQFVGLIAKHAQLDDSLVTTISFDDYWKDKLASGAAKRPKNSWMDSGKLQARIGTQHFYSLDENIRAWISKHNG